MLRIATALLLPALFVLVTPAAEAAQRRVPPGWGHGLPADGLAGTYENVSGGGTCYVVDRGRTFLFVNEHGSEAVFAYSGPGRLNMVWGEWDPSVTCTVGRDPYGRIQLRFSSPSNPPGYWVRVS